MNISTNSLESVAAELYSVIRELKTQSNDLLMVESANRAMQRYEKFKRAHEDKAAPMLPGYESSYDKNIEAGFEDLLFDSLCNRYAS